MNLTLVFLRAALALQTVRGGAQSFGHILVQGQEFQVLRLDMRQKVQRNLQGALWIEHQVAHHRVVLAELAVGRYLAQGFVGEAGQAGEALDFLLGESRVRSIAVKEDPARLRPSDVPVLVGDAAKARKAVGWAPEIPFERTLRDLLGYWRQRLAGVRS